MYELMETDPSIEFDYRLVEKLGWRSVTEMRRYMPYAEYVGWCVYYGRKAQRAEMAKG